MVWWFFDKISLGILKVFLECIFWLNVEEFEIVYVIKEIRNLYLNLDKFFFYYKFVLNKCLIYIYIWILYFILIIKVIMYFLDDGLLYVGFFLKYCIIDRCKKCIMILV